MAKNRGPVKPVQPESSEEEEETDASSDEQSDPIPKPNTLSNNNKLDSEEEEESESDEKEESDPKPEPVQLKLTPSKRPLEQEKLNTKHPKKPKKAEKKKNIVKEKKAVDVDSAAESSKKVLFQRFWTEEDEIVILKGMHDYKETPLSNLDGFLDSIKDDLHSAEVTKDQLRDKIRRLKNKFFNNRAKKVRNFAKPYEKEAYEISEKIWGNETKLAVVTNANKVDVGKSTSNGVAENGEGKKKVVGLFDSKVEKMMRMGAEMFEGEEVVKGSKEWKKLEREEMELLLKQMDVTRAKMKLIVDTMVD